jgi:predicted dehydrogenase/threonine dehydrogenase-like Zn-dependent dehydrogenase
VVLEAGTQVTELRPGDRVACGGGGYAVHAELNHVPVNLCVPLPDAVSFEAGSFATVGSIALHGVRQAEAKLGERVAVIGLGLVGQLTCRLLSAAGCAVVGIDVVGELCERARAAGVDAFRRGEIDRSDPPAAVRDCDAVIITAATGSDDPVQLAGALGRDRARVVIVGDVGMDLPRSTYYGKELDLRLSRSYGPGRYDREYEERGLDYPIGYVRWTERRNMRAVVDLLARERISVDDLVTSRFPIEHAADAYDRLLNDSTSPLGLVLVYPAPEEDVVRPPAAPPTPRPRPAANPRIGVVGAGSFSQRVMIPGLRDAGFELSAVASATGLSATAAKERFGFSETTTPDELLESEGLDVIAIASRHGSHAAYAIQALMRGRAVFVEKPPVLNMADLRTLRDVTSHGRLQVGFNRRFAPLAIAMRGHLRVGQHPVELLYRIAAGRLAHDHWLNDLEDGGGRLLGEGCHFVDFACWLMGDLPEQVSAQVPESPNLLAASPRFAITLTFANESIATILYGSESAPAVTKELVEAHSGGRSATLHDYRRLELSGPTGRPKTERDRGGDKGHRAQFVAFRKSLEGEGEILTSPSALDTMEVTLQALAAAGGSDVAPCETSATLDPRASRPRGGT